MGKNFFKYVCMIWTMSTNIPAYNSIQPSFALNIQSKLVELRDDEANPLESELYQATNTKRRQLLEATNDEEHEPGFGTISPKLQGKYLGPVARNEEDDSATTDLRKIEMGSEKKEHDSNIESISGDNKESGVFMETKPQKEPREPKSLSDLNERFHIRKVFDKFGDGDTMSYEGFERLLKTLGLQRLVSVDESSPNFATTEAMRLLNASSMQAYKSSQDIPDDISSQDSHVCLKSRDIFSDYISSHGAAEASTQTGGDTSGDERNLLSEDTLLHMCPSLLYQLTSATTQEMEEGCFLVKEAERKEKPVINMGQVWLFATLSIIGISLCGFVGVAMVPIMQHELYQQLLHFLISMAIGTLCGDALLHLLPEAMAPNANQGHEGLIIDMKSHGEGNTRKGFVAAIGIVFFFFFEQCLLHGGKWFKRRQRKKKILSRMLAKPTQDEKTSKKKKSNYPYGYEELSAEVSGKNKSTSPVNGNLVDNRHIAKMADGQEQLPMNISTQDSDRLVGDQEEEGHELVNLKMESHSIAVREPQNDLNGHTHGHGHGHSHLSSDNTSTIAYMVIMGDGLDNFTDGLAIGAAFAASIAGGFSTVIAVFFHELPHELGDFAVLIKAGMSIKEVVFYNLISSGLCLLGMIVGVILGQDERVLKWVFAIAAGLFLYIALVDMIPELTRTHTSGSKKVFQLLLQLLGLVSGLGVMLLIASLDDQFQNLFAD